MACRRSGVQSPSTPLVTSVTSTDHICNSTALVTSVTGVGKNSFLVKYCGRLFAKVAELVYALVSKTSGLTAVRVQLPPLALVFYGQHSGVEADPSATGSSEGGRVRRRPDECQAG